MARHGAYAAFVRGDGLPGGSIGRQLPALFNFAELRQAPRAQALLRDAWMPGIGVMAARLKQDSIQGLYLAAEAGNNGKSHNHNDVGNFVVYADGSPVIIDVGVETYTAKTFSSKRYEIWTMQSAYHNCPTINGVMQSPGREFRATAAACRQDDQTAELHMEIAGAYPAEANLESWRRLVRLDRTRNRVEITDEYSLKQPAHQITLTLMTPCRVEQSPRTLHLENRAHVAYDAGLTAAVEELKLEDPRLRTVWGDRIYRILLYAKDPPRQGKWGLIIGQS
jgi:hypothetical protein